MSSSVSSLGPLKDSIKPGYFSHQFSIHKHGSFFFGELPQNGFVWILWYIWKGRNNKVFSNLDIDPRETLRITETKSILWAETQLNITRTTQLVEARNRPSIPGRWCFTDGSWKDKEPYSGQSWYSTLEDFDGLMEAQNVRATLSPLHSEVESLIWAMECISNLR